MVYGDFKYLARRTASDKLLCGKAFNIAKNPRHGRGLASMVYKFFDKKSSSLADKSAAKGIDATLPNKFTFKTVIKANKQLAEKLHEPIIKIF